MVAAHSVRDKGANANQWLIGLGLGLQAIRTVHSISINTSDSGKML